MPTRRTVLSLGAVATLATACGSPAPEPQPANDKGLALPAHELVAQDDEQLRTTLRLVKDLGCDWVRFDFYWDGIEPEKGRFAWTDTDRLVDFSLEQGLQILGILHTTPAWLRPPNTPHVFAPVEANQISRWANFCGAAALHYKGRVAAWELWNEPNLIAFWAPTPSPEAYARLILAAWPAITGSDPAATIVTGGPGGPTRPGELDPLSFIQRMLDAGATNHFHAIGLHPYTNLSGKPDGALGQAVDVAAELKRRGLEETALWGTETGAPTQGKDGVVISEPEQAQLITSTFDFWREAIPHAGPLFWYTLRDTGNSSRYETYGLVRANGEQKPGLDKLRRTKLQR